MKFPIDICLAGASGLVGHELLLLLSHIDHISTIKAPSRHPLGKVPAKVDNMIINMDSLAQYKDDLRADVFICCLGTTMKSAGSKEAFRKVDYDYVLQFAKIAEAVQAQKFLVITAMGANSKSSVFYNRVKGELEEALYNLNIPQIEIFRPSLILGERKNKRRGEDLAQKLSPFLNPLLRGSLKKYRAIHSKIIARAMAVAALNFHEGRYIYESDEIQNIADSVKADPEEPNAQTESPQNP